MTGLCILLLENVSSNFSSFCCSTGSAYQKKVCCIGKYDFVILQRFDAGKLSVEAWTLKRSASNYQCQTPTSITPAIFQEKRVHCYHCLGWLGFSCLAARFVTLLRTILKISATLRPAPLHHR